MIPGEGTSRSICAMFPRCQPDYEQPGIVPTERRHRSGMITRAFHADAIEISRQTRAAPAGLREARQGARHLS